MSAVEERGITDIPKVLQQVTRSRKRADRLECDIRDELTSMKGRQVRVKVAAGPKGRPSDDVLMQHFQCRRVDHREVFGTDWNLLWRALRGGVLVDFKVESKESTATVFDEGFRMEHRLDLSYFVVELAE